MSEQAVAAAVPTGGPAQNYILFSVAGTTYALRSQQVLHVEMVEHVTPVPNAPRAVEGVVFSRGEVVPVVNLRARFGFERTPLDMRTRLLVVQHGQRRVGLLADDAREFLTIGDEAVHPPHETIGGSNVHYIDGVATLGQRIVLIINLSDVVEAIGPAAIQES